MTLFVIILIVVYPTIVIGAGLILFVKTWKAWHE